MANILTRQAGKTQAQPMNLIRALVYLGVSVNIMQPLLMLSVAPVLPLL